MASSKKKASTTGRHVYGKPLVIKAPILNVKSTVMSVRPTKKTPKKRGNT